MSAQLLLRCGCEIAFTGSHVKDATAPICPAHGVQSVVRVIGMPRPRIRGTATGPCVETVDLAPFVGRLKEQD